jgi:hypothetical protein
MHSPVLLLTGARAATGTPHDIARITDRLWYRYGDKDDGVSVGKYEWSTIGGRFAGWFGDRDIVPLREMPFVDFASLRAVVGVDGVWHEGPPISRSGVAARRWALQVSAWIEAAQASETPGFAVLLDCVH